MKRKILSLMLAAVMALGLAVPAMAYSTPDFSDVPSNHWAYESVMKMADAGVIKGTGAGIFSPEMKLSAEMFVVLVGRVVFPDVKAEEADWSGPYVTEAKAKGLLEGTNITDSNLKGDISRYDMAVILAKCVDLLKVSATKADSSKVADYGEVPAKYIDAVLMAYGSGLIRGDQSGSFNGANSMTRQEAATVMDRLLGLVSSSSKGESATDSKEPDSERPSEAAYSLSVWGGQHTDGVFVPGERVVVGANVKPADAAPYGYDRTGFTITSSDPSILEVTGVSSVEFANWYVVAHKEGTATLTVTDPCGVTGSKECKVVAAREDAATKTYSLSIFTAKQEKHSLRGNAYTEMTFIPDVPYKIYYTRDGGKTSQLVYEGVAPSEGGDAEDVQIELPEDAFYSKDAGFYVSAETVLNGQRLVTSDLRTDGRAYASLVHNLDPEDPFLLRIKLTPPTGEKARFTFKGAVGYGGNNGPTVDAGFIVRLYLKDGRLVAEATTDSTGHFSMDCEVDALDNGFNPDVDQYYVTASGIQNGVYMEENGKRPNGELRLWSLNFIGANPYNPSGMPISVK